MINARRRFDPRKFTGRLPGGDLLSLGMANTIIPFLRGVGFYLRELQMSDLEGNWYRWFNDEEITRFQNKHLFPHTIEKQRRYYESLQADETEAVLAIIEDTTDKHIGNVGLHKIDWVHRSAELGIVIGEKEYWGKSIGKQAWRMITEYGFRTLNLHRVGAIIMDGNTSSFRCAEAAGFKVEGRIRQMFYKNGKYIDGFYLNVLASEFPRSANKETAG